MERQHSLFESAEETPLFSGSPVRARAEAFNPAPVPPAAHTRSFLDDDAGAFRVALRHRPTRRLTPLGGTYDSFAAAFSRAEALQAGNRDPHYEYVVQAVEELV